MSDASVALAVLPVRQVFDKWAPGSEDWTWAEEAADVIDRDGPRIAAMIRAMRGLDRVRDPLPGEEPIMLGDDGRVWDGHHRLVAAWLAGVSLVPVEVVS